MKSSYTFMIGSICRRVNAVNSLPVSFSGRPYFEGERTGK